MQLSALLLMVVAVAKGDYIVTTLAGNGTYGYADGSGSNAMLYYPYGVAAGQDGSVYVADSFNNRIRVITPAGVVSSLAGSSVGFADGSGINAKFNQPIGIAVNASGYVYAAEWNNNRIRIVSPSGVVTTLAGSAQGYADGDSSSAMFYNPCSVVLNASGSVYVADFYNNRIRVVSPGGYVSTFAGGIQGFADGYGPSVRFYYPQGVAIGTDGNIYVADTYNHRIRVVTPVGVVSTLAGTGTLGFADGSGTSAMFNGPTGIAFGANGNMYVVDQGNHRIRVVTPGGVVSTLAGNGTLGFADGSATSSMFYYPHGITVSPDGSIYVADVYNHRIRVIQMTTTSTSTTSSTSTTTTSTFSSTSTTSSTSPTTSSTSSTTSSTSTRTTSTSSSTSTTASTSSSTTSSTSSTTSSTSTRTTSTSSSTASTSSSTTSSTSLTTSSTSTSTTASTSSSTTSSTSLTTSSIGHSFSSLSSKFSSISSLSTSITHAPLFSIFQISSASFASLTSSTLSLSSSITSQLSTSTSTLSPVSTSTSSSSSTFSLSSSMTSRLSTSTSTLSSVSTSTSSLSSTLSTISSSSFSSSSTIMTLTPDVATSVISSTTLSSIHVSSTSSSSSTSSFFSLDFSFTLPLIICGIVIIVLILIIIVRKKKKVSPAEYLLLKQENSRLKELNSQMNTRLTQLDKSYEKLKENVAKIMKKLDITDYD